MKSYTDIEQSRKLAEILPIESADMCYEVGEDLDGYTTKTIYTPLIHTPYDDNYIPCWSLAALRNRLPSAIKPNKDTYLFESHNTFDNSWVYRYYYNEGGASYLYCKDINEVDACYEMILKLHELKML